MTDVDVDAIAERLLAAYRDRVGIPPLTASYDKLTVDDAFAIQQRQADLRVAAGARVAGFKVGLTSAAMREQLGVFEPDYGHLFADMLCPADEPISVESFLQPRAEPEIALVLGADLAGPDLSVADVAAATACVLPAIEIIDSRISDWRIALEDTIADNGSSGGLVLGAAPVPLADLDLALLGCVLRRNGRIEQTGAGAAVLGSPLQSATWLANSLTARGVRLRAGHVILTGSITAAVPVRPGDAVTVTIDRLGSVTAVFD
jgi:2-keto-4-pentenoate hydratase